MNISYTKYMKNKEWTLAPQRFFKREKAKAFVANLRRVAKNSDKKLYYRIKGSFGDFEVWYRVEKR